MRGKSWPVVFVVVLTVLPVTSGFSESLAPAQEDVSAQIPPSGVEVLAGKLTEYGPNGPASLEDAVAAAHLAVAWQVGEAGIANLPAPSLHGYLRPSDALQALADRHQVEIGDETLSRLLEWERYRGQMTVQLARFVDAFLVFDDSARAMAAEPDTAVLVGQTIAARARLLDATVGLQAAMGEETSVHSRSCVPISVPPVFSLDLEGCDDLYDENYFLSLDVGGADEYYNNGGGNFGTIQRCSLVGLGNEVGGAAAFVDFGAGDDQYGAFDRFLRCGVNGGAYQGGAGFLLDDGGNDTYIAYAWGVNGGATAGSLPDWKPALGFLLDAGGDDFFASSGFGANGGAAYAAIGSLLNLGGNDQYYADGEGANGGGLTTGIGMLADVGGDDLYHAHDYAVNGEGDFGIGALIDLYGQDRYEDDAVPGGSCEDCSLLPKGTAGAQLDT